MLWDMIHPPTIASDIIKEKLNIKILLKKESFQKYRNSCKSALNKHSRKCVYFWKRYFLKNAPNVYFWKSKTLKKTLSVHFWKNKLKNYIFRVYFSWLVHKCCYKLADYQIFVGIYTFVLSDIYEYLCLRIVVVYDIIPMKARDFYGFEKKSIW